MKIVERASLIVHSEISWMDSLVDVITDQLECADTGDLVTAGLSSATCSLADVDNARLDDIDTAGEKSGAGIESSSSEGGSKELLDATDKPSLQTSSTRSGIEGMISCISTGVAS